MRERVWMGIAAGLGMVALAPAAQAQGANPAWMAGKWGLGGNCDPAKTPLFDMEPDGTLRSGGGDGQWRVEGNQLVFIVQGQADRFPFIKISNDQIEIVKGPMVTRCGHPLPPLSAAWVNGTRWSGHGNCSVVITFERGGRVHLSNGATGSWSISGGRILMAVGDRPLSLERRSERQLIEVESQSAFTRC